MGIIVIHDIFNNQIPNLFNIPLEMYNIMILLHGRRHEFEACLVFSKL